MKYGLNRKNYSKEAYRSTLQMYKSGYKNGRKYLLSRYKKSRKESPTAESYRWLDYLAQINSENHKLIKAKFYKLLAKQEYKKWFKNWINRKDKTK